MADGLFETSVRPYDERVSAKPSVQYLWGCPHSSSEGCQCWLVNWHPGYMVKCPNCFNYLLLEMLVDRCNPSFHHLSELFSF